MNHPVPTERSFGVSVGTVCGLLAALSVWRGYDLAVWVFAGVSVVLLLGGLLAPRLLRGPNRVWWRFAQALGWVNTRLLLTVFFFIVITPAGLMMRLVGRNPLQPSDTSTSWSPYPARRRNRRHYEQSF